ncbi:MAG: shikimate kinase [Bacteroidota bacterium]
MSSRIERLYLTGFMTSGKSTIGPILANVIGWTFKDLDIEIEKYEGLPVVDIFSQKGEDYFRDLEYKLLAKFSEYERLVLALGGGTIVNPKNLDLMKKTGKIIYLKSSPEMIYQRIKNKIDRPIFRDLVLSDTAKPKDFIERIKKLQSEREPFYAQAHFSIDTDKTRVGITVDNLVKTIRKYIHEKN